MSKRIGLLAIAFLPALAHGRGVTPYLPLNLDPEIERQIERVLILGDKPALRRPIPAAWVVDALPKACTIDAGLCERVQKYLDRFMQDSGVTLLSIEGSVGTGSDPALPNQHGEGAQSRFQVAAAGYLQLNDFALLNVGGVAYQGRATPTGTVLSLGFDFAQLDIGWRDHWWSPMTNSSMLISTEAPTMPSITLSSYEPITPLGIDYEVFLARMSYSTQIQTGTDGHLTRGYPKMAGAHVGLQPVAGWALGASRVLVFGGGEAGGQSIGDVLDAFFDPSKAQSTGFGPGRPVVGKQEASVSSELTFPGPVPFSVYAEYAGNDTSYAKNYLFGKPDLSFGIHLPRLGRFDLTLETSTWAPTWYVHPFSNALQTGYLDGITNDGRSIGNWFGDQRLLNDGVGGETHLVRLGYEPSFGGRFEVNLRMLRNDSIYSAIPYQREYMGSLSYARPWHGYAVGGQIDAGRDVFGERYARLAAFMRLGDALPSSWSDDTDAVPDGQPRREPGSEVFVDIGANGSQIYRNILPDLPRTYSAIEYGPHLGIGARRQISTHQDLGMRIEADDVQGRLMLSVRALDYRVRFNGPLAIDLFAGATRYSLDTTAFGWYLGAGPEWRDIVPGWDLAATFRYGVKVARLRELPTDPSPMLPTRPDSFHDIYTAALYLSHKL